MRYWSKEATGQKGLPFANIVPPSWASAFSLWFLVSSKLIEGRGMVWKLYCLSRWRNSHVIVLYWIKCLLLVGERKFYGHMTAKDSHNTWQWRTTLVRSERCYWMTASLYRKYNTFSDRESEQKHRTMTFAELPNHSLLLTMVVCCFYYVFCPLAFASMLIVKSDVLSTRRFRRPRRQKYSITSKNTLFWNVFGWFVLNTLPSSRFFMSSSWIVVHFC